MPGSITFATDSYNIDSRFYPALDNVIEIGAGESRPIASNANAAGKARNRRVEITLVPLRS